VKKKYLDAEVLNYKYTPDAMVYITKHKYYNEIKDDLLNLGYSESQISFIDEVDFSYDIDFIEYFKIIDHAGLKYRSFKEWQYLSKNYKKLFDVNSPIVYQRVELTITEKCNLRCTHCANLMQYFEQPEDVCIEQVKKDFDTLVDVFDYICEILIIGGEPFVYSDIDKILEHMISTREKWNDKVGSIELVTNGIIIPKESTFELLKQLDCYVYFSNYGFYDKNAERFVEKLKEYQIDYIETKDMFWSNVNQICDEESVGEAERKSENCLTYHGAIKKGRFHRCCFLANAVDLPGFLGEIESNYISLSTDMDKTKLIDYISRKIVPSGCSYCTGNEEYLWECSVPRALQSKKPIKYIKHRKQK